MLPPPPAAADSVAVRVGVAGIALPGAVQHDASVARPAAPPPPRPAAPPFQQAAPWTNAGGGGDAAGPRQVLGNVTKAQADDVFAGGLRS